MPLQNMREIIGFVCWIFVFYKWDTIGQYKSIKKVHWNEQLYRFLGGGVWEINYKHRWVQQRHYGHWYSFLIYAKFRARNGRLINCTKSCLVLISKHLCLNKYLRCQRARQLISQVYRNTGQWVFPFLCNSIIFIAFLEDSACFWGDPRSCDKVIHPAFLSIFIYSGVRGETQLLSLHINMWMDPLL